MTVTHQTAIFVILRSHFIKTHFYIRLMSHFDFFTTSPNERQNCTDTQKEFWASHHEPTEKIRPADPCI